MSAVAEGSVAYSAEFYHSEFSAGFLSPLIVQLLALGERCVCHARFRFGFLLIISGICFEDIYSSVCFPFCFVDNTVR